MDNIHLDTDMDDISDEKFQQYVDASMPTLTSSQVHQYMKTQTRHTKDPKQIEAQQKRARAKTKAARKARKLNRK